MTSWQGKQNNSTAEKPNTKQQEKRQREWQRATGSMWPSLRFLPCTRGMKEMHRGREDEKRESEKM